MPDRVHSIPAEYRMFDGASELLGTPGAYTLGVLGNAAPEDLTPMRRRISVCCPGCGSETYLLTPDAYPMVGSDDNLTCKVPITFVCCGTWNLTQGFWHRVVAAE